MKTYIQGGKVRNLSQFEKVMNKVQGLVLFFGLVFFASILIRLILSV